MKIVLTMGASMNNKTSDGTPIFVEACKNAIERKEMCLMLLEGGADAAAFEDVTFLNKNRLIAAFACIFKKCFFFEENFKVRSALCCSSWLH